MANARPTSLRSTSIVRGTCVTACLLALASVEGCSCSDESDTTPTTSPGSLSINPAAHGDAFSTPFDATPDPKGKTVYFTALSPEGLPGVFAAPADGSAPAKAIAVGAPFVAPTGIAISADGATLYVADAGAETTANGGADGGAIFSLSTGGGTPSPLAGSEGTKPRSLELMLTDKAAALLFSGVDAKDGHASVFSMAPGGGSPTDLAASAKLVDPSGIAVAASGAVYVVDTIGDSGNARVVALKAGAVSTLIDGLLVGYPAGATLTKDDSTLLVSAIDPDKGTDVVYLVDAATGEAATFSTDIDTYVESAGLHRARDVDVFAWADSKAKDTGTVFVVTATR